MPYQTDHARAAPLSAAAEQTMIPMRDGARLATDVYLPERPRRLSTVLVRLPYDKCGRYTFMPQLAPHFTDRGYAFVVQDVRGKFRSEGETMPFVHEIEDGYDTLEWIVSQPWSNGSVGMWGDSYYGYTQWAVVASGHPALKAIVPRVTSTDFMDSPHWWGDFVMQLYGADYLAHFWTDNFIHDFPVDWSRRPLAEVFDEGFAQIGKRSQAFDQLMLHRQRGGFSMYPRGRHPFDHQCIPALHSVGWFDNVAPASMSDYTRLCARADRARLQYLVADATDHENYHLRQFPVGPDDDHDADDAALGRMLPSLASPALDFFDVFLSGRGRPDDVPRVRWYLGHDTWHESLEWPPRDSRELRLYLSAPGRATAGAQGGALTPAPDRANSVARWLHDPQRLVPSALQDPFSALKYWPDEREIEDRDDVPTFTSEPAVAPLDLVGPVTAVLGVGSSAASMHAVVKLLDVFPDGSSRMLVRGQAHVGRPHTRRPTSIDLGHTGYRVQVGHSLRLHVASSDFPLCLWHPGTPEDPWYATEGATSRQELATGGSSPSFVSLTVLPAGIDHGLRG